MKYRYFAVILLVGSLGFAVAVWMRSSILFEVGDSRFVIPRSYILSLPLSLWGYHGDASAGVSLALPNQFQSGEWGVLLQPTGTRKASGFPESLNSLLVRANEIEIKTAIKFDQTSGMYRYLNADEGEGAWYFIRLPLGIGSIYSSNAVFCRAPEYCQLYAEYKGVDIEITIDKAKRECVEQALFGVKKYLQSFGRLAGAKQELRVAK